MIVRNCENCCIYLFDHTNTVTIDDCKNCKVFVGPTQEGNLFDIIYMVTHQDGKNLQ